MLSGHFRSFIRIAAVLIFCTAVSLMAFPIYPCAAGTEKERPGAGDEKEDPTEYLISQADSASGKKKLTVFGRYEPDETLMELLSQTVSRRKKDGYDLGFMMIDLTSGGGIAYDPDKMFYSASSVKGIYAAAMTDAYPETLENEWDTLADVLIFSSNEEYEYLWYSYGSDCIRHWAEDSGVSDVDWDSEMYVTYSARDLTKLWLKNQSYFKTDGGKELAKLYESPDMSVIYQVLGKRYRTRSKAGWIPQGWDVPTYNDAGIIYAEDRPYILCFLSDIGEERMGSSARIVQLIDLIHQTEGRKTGTSGKSAEEELVNAVLAFVRKAGFGR